MYPMQITRHLALILCLAIITACGSGSSAPENSAAASNVFVQDENDGKTWVGDRLIANYSIANSASNLVAVNWLRNGLAIDGAADKTYVISASDVGQSLAVEVTPIDSMGASIGATVRSADVTVDRFVGSRFPFVTFDSSQTNWIYPIRVYLPDGYDAGNQSYPVIFTLDGGEFRFGLFADILDEKAKQVILVAIGTGGAYGDILRRQEDYVMPGARDYYNFLTLELLPFIDSQYRTEKSNRTLVGHSLGGLFTGLALLMETPGERNFASFVSQDGSYWDKPEETIALEEALYNRTQVLPVKLILSSTLQGNFLVTRDFRNLLQARNYQELDLSFLVFDVTHREEFNQSFRRAVDILFP